MTFRKRQIYGDGACHWLGEVGRTTDDAQGIFRAVGDGRYHDIMHFSKPKEQYNTKSEA